MSRSEALKRAQARYQKKKCVKKRLKHYILACHIVNDADIIEILSKKENKSGYIKQLIRNDAKGGE